MVRRTVVLACAALLACGASGQVAAQGQALSVRADPRAELLAIVFRLAGNPEYGQGQVPGFNKAIDAHFATYRDHPAVQAAGRLRAQNGVSFDAVMSLAIHIDGVASPRPRRAFTSPDTSLERRWTPAAANAFVEQLAAFVRDAHFAEFLAANQPLLDSARVRMERVVRANLDVAALTAYFGRAPNGEFIMVPLLTSGSGNYGVRYLEGEREEVYAIIGTGSDSTGQPMFDERFVPTMVHEFSHSFVNPAVAPVRERFRAAGEAIFPAVAQEMRQQAYGAWETMLNESLVRASVARYVRAKRGDAAGRLEAANQQSRGFLWTPELYDLLGEYEGDRARYPTFDSFLPRVAEYFDALVPRLPQLVASYNELRPKLVASEPANGATGVDPSLGRIVFRFDRPMAPGVNINLGPTGREHFPDVKKFGWNEAGTELTLEVALKPAWTYDLVLGPGFRSRASNVGINMTVIAFSTR